MTGAYSERLSGGNCRENAWWMVAMYPELSYVEGYVVFTESDETERRMEHAWNEAPDGRIVDSTAWAFAGTAPYRYERDLQAWPRLAESMRRFADPARTDAAIDDRPANSGMASPGLALPPLPGSAIRSRSHNSHPGPPGSG